MARRSADVAVTAAHRNTVPPSDEAGLFARVRDGDREAEKVLVERHHRLARKIALKHAPFCAPGLDDDDLVGEALLALVLAIRGFDPDRGVRFSTYAYATIARRVRKSIATSATIRVPEYAVIADYKRRAAGEDPPEFPCVVASLDEHEVGTDHPLHETIADDRPGPEEIVAPRGDHDDLHLAIDALPRVLGEIIRRRFGLAGPVQEPGEAGAALGLGPRTVQTYASQAIRMLRERLTAS